jgi:hypothetical protein
MLILASEKKFRYATLQKSCIEKATDSVFYTCGENIIKGCVNIRDVHGGGATAVIFK